MKAWTYAQSPGAGGNKPYWVYITTPVIALEYPDGRMEWRIVETGAVHRVAGTPIPAGHRGKLLDPQYYPQWYRDMDDYAVDEGL